MRKRKLKSFVIYGMYALSIIMLIGGVFFIESIVDNEVFKDDEIEEVEYVEDNVDDNVILEDIPVVSTEVRVARPYLNGNVKVLKSYYDRLLIFRYVLYTASDNP